MKQTKRFHIMSSSRFGNLKIIVDKHTRVQYLFAQSGYSGGLTPLIDQNGKPLLYTGGDEEIE